MKQVRIVEAYKALTRIAGQDIPVKMAWAVAKQLNALKPFWQFQLDEERRFLESHSWKPHENGGFVFDNVDDAKTFNERMGEIAELEQDINIKPFTISVEDDIKISANDLNTLAREFIEVKED